MNIHTALKSDEYKKAREIMTQNKPFDLCDEFGERKQFIPGSIIYNRKDLRFFFKLAHYENRKIWVEVVTG